jgi:hypothetical protein
MMMSWLTSLVVLRPKAAWREMPLWVQMCALRGAGYVVQIALQINM